MDDIQRLNSQLQAFPRQIFEATKKTEILREAWMLDEAKKDYENAKAFLTAKAESMTDGMAKAKAAESIYQTAQQCIVSESAYRRAVADQTRLENEFVSVRKQASLFESHVQKFAEVA